MNWNWSSCTPVRVDQHRSFQHGRVSDGQRSSFKLTAFAPTNINVSEGGEDRTSLQRANCINFGLVQLHLALFCDEERVLRAHDQSSVGVR